MAKKEAETYPCAHCAKEFRFEVKWCPSCLCHMEKAAAFRGKKEKCTRCLSGINSDWIASKEAMAAKAAAFELKMEEVKAYWSDPNRDRGPLAEAYAAWCASPEYAERFLRGVRK